MTTLFVVWSRISVKYLHRTMLFPLQSLNKFLDFLSESFVINNVAFIIHVSYFRGLRWEYCRKRVNMNMHSELPIMLVTLYHFHSSADVGITNRRGCLYVYGFAHITCYIPMSVARVRCWEWAASNVTKCQNSRKWLTVVEHYYNIMRFLTITFWYLYLSYEKKNQWCFVVLSWWQ